MVEPLSWFIKNECLNKNAGEVVDSLANNDAEQVKNYLNRNVTKLTRVLFSDKIKSLGKSIFTNVDTNKDRIASKDEIIKYFKDTYDINEEELMNMNVEEVIIRIDKYLKEHPEKKPKLS